MPAKIQYWLVSRHDQLGIDAFVFGPFKTEVKALNYPNTFFASIADSLAFRYPYSTRVVALPKGQQP